MKNKETKKITINILTIGFIFYSLFVIINDYFCFFFKTNYNKYFYLSSLLICLIIFLFIRKKINFKKPSFNKLDFLVFFILLWVFWSRMTIPDSSFDTLNYHIYLQNRLFSNNVSFNFFPSRWINTFSFPLGDRMHFPVRFILGYRLGMFLNVLILFVIYYQIKEILAKFINNKEYIAIISTIILLTEQILSNMIVYYVDLMSIPLILEIILIVISKEEKSNNHNFMLLLISGILCALKISNAFFIIPFVVIYLIKNYKTVNLKTILFGIPLLIFPMLVYMLNNYIQTGNPVFPFYNSIFKSKYLSNTNWIEDYYGPKTTLERLFWPIYVFWKPRKAFDTDTYYNRIGYGYIAALVIMLFIVYKKLIKKEKINDFNKLCILYIVLTLIWSNFVMGYIRYALFLEVLSGIIIAIFLYKSIISRSKLSIITSMLCLYAFSMTLFSSTSDMFKTSKELSWRNTYYVDKLGYETNKDYRFSKNWDYSFIENEVDCVGILDYNSGYASMIFKNNRILSLNEGYYNEYGKKELEKLKSKCKNIYTISTINTLERTEELMDKNGYERAGDNEIFMADFLNYYNKIVVFKIQDKQVKQEKQDKKVIKNEKTK